MEFAIFSYFQSQKLCYRFLQYFGEKIVMQFRKWRGGGILGFFRLFRLSKLFRFYKVCSQSFPSREMEKRMTWRIGCCPLGCIRAPYEHSVTTSSYWHWYFSPPYTEPVTGKKFWIVNLENMIKMRKNMMVAVVKHE